MTVRLTIRRLAWETHVRDCAAATPGLVPVVKGNGYGFGRDVLHPIAATLADRVAVGSVHELDHIPAGVTPIVLTPALAPPPALDPPALAPSVRDAPPPCVDAPLPALAPPAGDPRAASSCRRPILTVASTAHVEALRGWDGAVVVKLRSSMGRYGVSPSELDALVTAIDREGLTVDGAAVHLPLAGNDAARRREIDDWLAVIPASWTLSVSHLVAGAYDALRADHPERRFELRAGTALWHGDKSFLHLDADVLDVQPAAAGSTAGYHATPVASDGSLVMIGAGSANGIAPMADGRSPFHFAQRRITLLEPPHMHTSIGIVARGSPCPAVGDRVDVQRPLITTSCDELVWLP